MIEFSTKFWNHRKLFFLFLITTQQGFANNVFESKARIGPKVSNLPLLIVKDRQQIDVTGNVTDEAGVPLIGVNIHVLGTRIGVQSNLEGAYELVNIDTNAVLEFSYAGYETQKISLNGKTKLYVVLKVSKTELDEIVVVGYSSQKKKDLTGAVSTVNIEDFNKSVSPFASQSLQGLVSGVRVTSNTGAPGEGAQIRIRGVGSLSGSNAPLYIIDGIPTNNGMDNISPADIENISVLKDAASTAIYGSRAGNGVVLITTKKGKKGQDAKITFNSSLGLQRHGELTKMTSKNKYVEIYNEAADNDNSFLSSDQSFLIRKKISPEYAATLPDVNHLESIFRSALLQQYHLGVSWGTEKTTYNFSGGYFDQEGILLESSYARANAKFSMNTAVKSWLNIGLNLNVYSDENNIVGSSGDGFGGNGGSAIRYAFFRTPAIPIYDSEGVFVDRPERTDFFGDGYNPVGVLQNTDNVRKNNGLFGDVNFKFDLSDDLFVISTIGVDRSSFKQRRFNKTWGDVDRINNPNSLIISSNLVSNSTISNVLNYKHTFNDLHSFTALLGNENIVNNEEYFEASDRNFVDQNPLLVTLGNGKGLDNSSEAVSKSVLRSFFAQANYNYDSRYFVSGVVRRDGSSRFAEGNQWGNFYSASLGWRIDKDLLKNNKYINKWMLRTGYGAVGDQQIPDFAYSSLVGINYNYPFGGVSQTGSAVVSLGNNSLSWATSKQVDVGTDISFFYGQLEFTFDYFHKSTEDMLLRISMPSSNGNAGAPFFNSGNVLNSGYEFDVTYRKLVSDDFSYSIKANASLLHNEVTQLDAPILAGRIDNNVYATKTEVGQPIGSFFLYTQEGIFQNTTEILTSAFQGNNIHPGDVKYKDINRDGIINELDRSHTGSSIPDVTFGLNTEFKYKNLSLEIFFSGAYGNKIYNQINTDSEGFYRPFNVTQRYYDERWTGEGTSNTQPRASWAAKSNNTRPSTRFLEDGSFVRLKNVQLGYEFNRKFLQALNLSKLRIYISASNLLTLTKYSGLDPEFSTNDNSRSEGDLAAGIDFGTYPNSTVIQSGLQLTF
ncbi:SusC/RagA family TonB-linked outer membrane protein [Flavobacterium sp. W22_SRS_FP1]|uniref:SusC/RagA family TonB-linked outer membrane protein n=1 Tax=Flavobacterium sp. W22_SRS_FP1 TaxID=3240276 RepID=UPI003F91EB20